MHAEAVKRYNIEIDDDGHVVGEKNNDSGAEIVRLAQDIMFDHPGTAFDEAVKRLQTKRPELFRHYGTNNVFAFTPKGLRHAPRLDHSTDGDPSAEIAEKVTALQAQDAKLSYEAAVQSVLKSDAALAGRYAAYVSNGRKR